MNIHRRITKLKLIGCVALLGMICCSCQVSTDKDAMLEKTSGENVFAKDNEEQQKGIGEGQQQGTEDSQQKGQTQDTEGGQQKDQQQGLKDGRQDEGLQEYASWEEYPWQMIPGKLTMENLLVTALSPVGQTMYIWGGGWNEEDTGAGTEATSLGLSPNWAKFVAQQTSVYDYYDYKYQIHDGLDCSGYIGWIIYNLFETENGQEGYVMKSSQMAENFAERGWGTFTPANQVVDWKLGDIMSMKGHVWLCLGSCQDGSVLILHSSIIGVIVCGTNLVDGGESEAVSLATDFMSTCYPDWYEKYPNCSRPYEYLTNSGQFRWSEEILSDAWDLKDYSAAELMHSLEKKLLAN